MVREDQVGVASYVHMAGAPVARLCNLIEVELCNDEPCFILRLQRGVWIVRLLAKLCTKPAASDA
jgi:hypothetical protein